MYIQDLFNPNQKKKLKGNKLVDNSKNLNSVYYEYISSQLSISVITFWWVQQQIHPKVMTNMLN